MTESVNILTDAAPVAVAVARNMAALRRARRFSLDALARRSGVSKGMLVQIEGGRANPSIATLCRIAAALGVAVAELVEVEEASPVRILPARSAAKLWTGPRGGSATLLAGTRGPDMLELWAWELRPGERHASEPHPPGTRELLHVHAGELELEVDGSAHRVPTGWSALAATDRPHAYGCLGPEPMRCTMAVFEPHAGANRRHDGLPGVAVDAAMPAASLAGDAP
jgi:transcriptional regulator with XRE-family HTH domain